MKKYLLLLFLSVLAICCSKDDNDGNNSVNADEPRMGNSAITNIYATGTLAEQTAEEAKKTIFGKWDFSSNNSSAKSAIKNGCSFQSLEFTDDSYLVVITDPNGESIQIYGDYDFKEENEKVVSVQLSTYFEGESVMVAEITDIVVEENNGVIDIAFKFNFKVDLIDYGIPCDPSLLNKDYSAEKDEPMDGTLEADKDSNHYKAVGKYLATSYTDSDGWDLDKLYLDPCIDYEYNSETGEETEVVDQDCTPLDAIQLELSTYGTYLFMQLSENSPLYIEKGTWAFNEDETKVTIGGPDGDFTVSISNLTESGMTMTIEEEEDDGTLYTATFVWEKQ